MSTLDDSIPADGQRREPEVQARLNALSGRIAVIWILVTIAASFAVSFFIPPEWWWLTPTVGFVSVIFITVYVLRRGVRWGTWMAAFWALGPHAMAWGFASIGAALS